jgi:hypothetical protein
MNVPPQIPPPQIPTTTDPLLEYVHNNIYLYKDIVTYWIIFT